MADAAEALPTENSEEISEPKRGGSANLKPFAKGVSGNPGGRPKGLASKVREVLGNDDGETLAKFWGAVLSGYVLSTKIVTGPDGSRVAEDYYEIVEVKDRIAVSKLLAERGWGKPPAYAPIEDVDPLGLSERETAEAAARFDARLDEVAAQREKNAQAAV